MPRSGAPMQVSMCELTAHVPPEILRSAQTQVEAIARELAEVDVNSPVWASMRESGVSLEVLGWKFKFTVEPDSLVLSEAHAIPPQKP